MTKVEIICTVISAVVAILGGTLAIVKFIFNKGMDKQHFVEFEKSVNENFGKIEGQFGKIEATVNSHTDVLIRISSFLGLKYPKAAEILAMKRSPRKLSPAGEKIFNDINGQKFLNENKERLFCIIDNAKPQTRLDVEGLSLFALRSMVSDSVFNPIKDYVYEAPALETADGKPYELEIDDICFTLSIPLRDMYIEERHIK